jgi:hypothetical protein
MEGKRAAKLEVRSEKCEGHAPAQEACPFTSGASELYLQLARNIFTDLTPR